MRQQKADLSWEGLERFPEDLLAWFSEHKRDLPWRRTKDPYHIMVSEVMLQQTRVEAVKVYYERFLREFPDLFSLAGAEEDRLLKQWEGLGYYSRARNLQRAASDVCFRFHGKMPASYEELLKLPGIGPYTAGAIASIAFQIPVPAVDGNMYRVLSRLRKDERLIDLPDTVRSVRKEITEILPKEEPGVFNQALMELGAIVCLPNGYPKCGDCPASSYCRAHLEECETGFPKKGEKKKRYIDEKTVLLIRDGVRTVIRKRGRKGLLAGMYEFPTLEGHLSRREVLEYLNSVGLKAVRIKKLPAAKHIFTNREWRMIGYEIRTDELERGLLTGEGREFLFLEKHEAQGEYPIPSAFSVYAKLLEIDVGSEKLKEKTV